MEVSDSELITETVHETENYLYYVQVGTMANVVHFVGIFAHRGERICGVNPDLSVGAIPTACLIADLMDDREVREILGAV